MDENIENSIVDVLKSDNLREDIFNEFENINKDNNNEAFVKETYSNINEIKEFIQTRETEINKYDSLENNKHKIIKFLKLVKHLNSLINNINIKDYSYYINKNIEKN
ncbi:hypothetical protein BCR32DRAFT_242571 [Anaeromyces robustus]|uniref:Uncharacterized protein n=1 Tax=Anaeromyces robustus TaxID=1754192 RepID=A0A1Y1XF82_9FUNG|nr:hypothetical protein BCR32DRAFT_242571 [Anaeromyces robustus]|eukprot:ORX84430.1 hypothetical protein BCR32DRAFT_242571 [Anaeromyces robustus]